MAVTASAAGAAITCAQVRGRHSCPTRVRPPRRQVRKLQMFGTTLFHVHNSKIFPSGHFLVAASSSGIQFLHPITKEELHSPFFFSDLQR